MADRVELDEGYITVNGQTVARMAPDAHIAAVNAFEDWFERRRLSPKEIGAQIHNDVLTKLKNTHATSAGLFTRNEIGEALEQVIRDL